MPKAFKKSESEFVLAISQRVKRYPSPSDSRNENISQLAVVLSLMVYAERFFFTVMALSLSAIIGL